MGLLDGKVAVITGAGSGMAKASTKLFVAEGAEVVAGDISGAQEPARAVKEPVAMPNEAAMRAMLAQMARHIVANAEDVGERFPEEARRIHYEEAPRRSIRGVASKEEADALEDEGIDVMQVPFADLVKNSLN